MEIGEIRSLFVLRKGGLPVSLFRIYMDGALFYHPHMTQLAITQAQVQEDAENIDSLKLAAPYNHC